MIEVTVNNDFNIPTLRLWQDADALENRGSAIFLSIAEAKQLIHDMQECIDGLESK